MNLECEFAQSEEGLLEFIHEHLVHKELLVSMVLNLQSVVCV